MKRGLIVFLFMLIASLGAQTLPDMDVEKKEVQEVILREAKAYFSRDYNAVSEAWLHGPDIYRVSIGTYWQYGQWRGWEEFDNWLHSADFRDTVTHMESISHDKHIIHTNSDMAWVTFEQERVLPGTRTEVRSTSQESRTLIRQNGRWKIVASISIKKYSTPEILDAEHMLNIAGYKLLIHGNAEDALKIFRLNTELFPKSANVYDSLSDAYLILDKETEALQNVQRTLETLPEDEYVSETFRKQLQEASEKKLEKYSDN